MREQSEAAGGTGEILRAVYDGGSSPGSARDLLALAILEDGKVRAKCLATGQAKIFVLSKMQLCFADVDLDNATTDALKTGKGPVKLLFAVGARHTVELPVSLDGFAVAFDAGLKGAAGK